MKAIEFDQYGAPEVLQLKEVEKPGPRENEILIRISTTTVTATEATFRKGRPLMARLFMGLIRPRIKRLGEEFAGEIEAVGANVSRFRPGDRVFGTANETFGANAAYLCLPEDGVVAHQPVGLSDQEAVTCIDGFLTALPFLRDGGKIKSGQKVLIYGASGSVGSAAVQLARHFGAEVTGVCSAKNADLVRSLGANEVIDYQKEDFSKKDKKYDIIFDTVGKISFSKSKQVLTVNGVFLEAAIGLGVFPQVLWTSVFGTKKAKIMATGLRTSAERRKDLLLVKKLAEAGTLKPVLDRTFLLEQLPDAHRYVDQGRKVGNVVIMVND